VKNDEHVGEGSDSRACNNAGADIAAHSNVIMTPEYPARLGHLVFLAIDERDRIREILQMTFHGEE
jgi:hypothetical protein